VDGVAVFTRAELGAGVIWRRWIEDRGSKAVMVLAGYLVVYLGWQLFRWGGPGHVRTIGDVAFWPVNLLAAVLALRVAGTRSFAPQVRRAWLLVGVGLVAYLLGNVLQLVYEAFLHEKPYPTFADAAYLAFYPLLLAGILQFPRDRFHGFAVVRVALDAAATVAAGAAIVWFVTLASATESGGSPLQLAVSIAYPCGDLLLIMALTALAVRARRVLGSWSLLLLKTSLVLYVVSDVVYGRMTLAGTYSGGSWIDTGWMLAIAMLAASANEQYRVAKVGLSPGERRKTDSGFVFLPYVATAVTFAIAVISTRSEPRLEIGSMVFLGVELVIVLGRLHWSTVDSRRNNRAAEQARSEFFATISHELRTPLTSIRGFCELLTDSDDVRGEAREFVRIIERNAEREERIVADLLFLNSEDLLGRIETVESDLVTIVDDAVSSRIPAAAQSHVHIEWTPPRQEITVHVDPDRMGQVVDNLLTNAIKFSGEETTVSVTVVANRSTATIRVQDSGPGIPEEEAAHIFERLYRGREAQQNAVPGAGLGLAIAHAIVEAFNGSILVEPHDGAGAVFRIDLPMLSVRAVGASIRASAVDSGGPLEATPRLTD
jgi:signal transduction histidine kinase